MILKNPILICPQCIAMTTEEGKNLVRRSLDGDESCDGSCDRPRLALVSDVVCATPSDTECCGVSKSSANIGYSLG